MSNLESRARRLLRFYPAPYRASRGEEILGTLLQASPEGRQWPTRRDAWSLVRGGLHARSGQNRQLPITTSLRLAAILGVALWLVWLPATLMSVEPFWPGARYVTGALLIVATVVAIWFAHRGVTIALALITAIALGLLAHHVGGAGVAEFVVPPLVLAAAVATEPVRPPRSWLCLPAAAAVGSALSYIQIMTTEVFPGQNAIVGIATELAFIGLLAAIVLWLTTDARPALALVFALALAIEPDFALAAVRGSATVPEWAAAVTPLALGALAALLLRRRTASARRAS